MKNKNNALKLLAEQAKKRMRSGEYTVMTPTVKNQYKSSYFYKNLYSMKTKLGKMEYSTIPDSAERDFYNKVVKLLSIDEDVFNPIGILAEKEILRNLNEIEKQYYILNLAERYLAAKEKYMALKNA